MGGGHLYQEVWYKNYGGRGGLTDQIQDGMHWQAQDKLCRHQIGIQLVKICMVHPQDST